MKIGLVIYGSIDTVSGGYIYDRKLVTYLRSCGDVVRVLSIQPGSYFSHLLDNVSFRLPSDLDILIEDELVHPSLLIANIRRKRPALPIISLVHNLHSSERRAGWQNALYRQVEKLHLNSVDAFIFNSTVTRESVIHLCGDSKPSVLASPGGDRLGSLSLDAVLGRSTRPGPLRLLFLANVTPLKGLHVLLDALSVLPPGCAALEVAGSLDAEPGYSRRMQEQAAALAAPVTFRGALDDAPLIELLRATDVLVVPSFYEGFGIAYLEGMAFGAPAIGTTAGAIPQMITDGVNGFTIAPGDSRTLARILERLSADRQLLAQLSANAVSYYSSCPTWNDSGERVRQFLLHILAGGASGNAQQ